MDDQQSRRVNEAAEKFAEAIKESYQALADRSVSVQELNAQLTQSFFNGVIDNLRSQAESNRELTQELIEQQQKQREASQALTQESVNAYTDFLNSMFAYPRQGTHTAGRAAREAGSERSTKSGGEEGVTEADATRHPLGSWVRTSSDAPSPPGPEERAPREAPPPGEERPERRGATPTTPPTTAREEPLAGEERPGRRTP